MSLSVGIVGLPNVGKSTLFNALLERSVAQTANYPFTTIKENIGVVSVPDKRLEKLGELIGPEKLTPATVRFVDIAGLVKGASRGEGLGNQFLAKVRECDLLVHVLRAFQSEDVPHFYDSVDPKRDREMVDLELALAEIKKPILFAVNTIADEKQSLAPGEEYPTPSIIVDAKSGRGAARLIKAAFDLLGLITFYTVKGGQEVRAWEVRKGATVLEASGKVHTDFANKFIKADVISFEDLVTAGGWQAAKESGLVRSEGREYEVKDGDVIEFRFGR